MIPSSATRLVDATSNAIDAVKLAPLRKRERASATAAYEQEEDAAPSPQAMAIERGESSGRSFETSFFETTACTKPERAKPRMSAQRISQNIVKAMRSAWRTWCMIASGMIASESRPGFREPAQHGRLPHTSLPLRLIVSQIGRQVLQFELLQTRLHDHGDGHSFPASLVPQNPGARAALAARRGARSQRPPGPGARPARGRAGKPRLVPSSPAPESGTGPR